MEELLAEARSKIQISLKGRSVHCIVEDFCRLKAGQLGSDSHDMAQCEEVPYAMFPDCGQVQEAVSQMARIVKPGGYVIARETRIGAEMQEVAGGPRYS